MNLLQLEVFMSIGYLKLISSWSSLSSPYLSPPQQIRIPMVPRRSCLFKAITTVFCIPFSKVAIDGWLFVKARFTHRFESVPNNLSSSPFRREKPNVCCESSQQNYVPAVTKCQICGRYVNRVGRYCPVSGHEARITIPWVFLIYKPEHPWLCD